MIDTYLREVLLRSSDPSDLSESTDALRVVSKSMLVSGESSVEIGELLCYSACGSDKFGEGRW